MLLLLRHLQVILSGNVTGNVTGTVTGNINSGLGTITDINATNINVSGLSTFAGITSVTDIKFSIAINLIYLVSPQ